MSGGFKQFIEKNVWKPVEDETTSIPVSRGNTNYSSSTPGVVTTPTQQTNEVDQQYLDHLFKFMEDNNISGPDYYEFANTLYEMRALDPSITDEKLFQMTFIGFKAQGVGVDTITNTANQYIQLFEKHKHEFETFLNNESQQTVVVREKENVDLNKLNGVNQNKIVEMQTEMDRLRKEIETNNQRVMENSTFIQSEKLKLNSKKLKFENAYNNVVSKLKDDIQKIKTYIK